MKKKKLILSAIILAVLLAAVFLLTRTSLRWSKAIETLTGDVHVSDIQDLQIEAKVWDLFFNEAELEIRLNGRPVRSGVSLVSQLSGFGDYILEAEYKGHIIEKEFTLARDYTASDPEVRAASLLFDLPQSYYDDLDTDGDGITDREEREKYGTDPYRADTDGDGYIDTHELFLGLDPLVKDNFDERRNYTIDKGSCRIYVSGYGNIADVFVDEIQVKELEESDFVIGSICQLTSPLKFGEHEKGTSTIEKVRVVFDLEPGIDADDVGIFTYDRKTGEISWLESAVNKDRQTISATIQNQQIFGLGYLSKKPDQIKTEVALVLDNSGSMFPMDYVTDNTNADPSEYGHDVDFNRVTLMQDLVGSLNSDKFLFSVGAFQAHYHRVTGMTDSKETVKSSLEKLKTEYQTFDGTSIETAINDGLDEFSKKSYNKKYMILLTDGYSATSWFQYTPSLSSVLSKAKNLRVEIITIGLGDCDEALLQKIAAETEGVYIHVRDSDALSKLLERLLSSLNELEVDQNGDGTPDAQMIADSGFRSDINGFPFENFGDENSPGGNCFGFAMTTKLIYEKALPYELNKTKLRGIAAWAMEEEFLRELRLDESTRELLNTRNPYDIHVPTLFLIDNPPHWDDLMSVNGNTGVIDAKYRQKLIDTGFVIRTVERQKTVDGQRVIRYEEASFDAWSDIAQVNVPPAELDIIRLINRNHKAQLDSLASREIGIMIRGSENIMTKDELIEPMIKLLDSGKPVLVGLECSLGGHAVLVTSMAYDLSNPNKIYLTIYDSNRPGLNATGTLERIKATREGEFYDKYRLEYKYGALDFTSIVITRIELFNGDTVFYKQ
ncbi:vWA domain-containing protein [Thermoclostridium caenicola]|uniref:von Willebrand factor type A domain-containing protein n=1 Tax=Thermoclostridium caenicola TaxID=659425 RepID=A0A1M6HXB5_9FIRM|nr:vWA domain-containing protein [Thermoclostridium caenicola]SHJ26714.1 von Willebrand factor type A domain-containing protein [Thermoclostridium caenicola]HOP72576.1 VWA domain-containing protein [Thermoclostridium caenicola]